MVGVWFAWVGKWLRYFIAKMTKRMLDYGGLHIHVSDWHFWDFSKTAGGEEGRRGGVERERNMWSTNGPRLDQVYSNLPTPFPPLLKLPTFCVRPVCRKCQRRWRTLFWLKAVTKIHILAGQQLAFLDSMPQCETHRKCRRLSMSDLHKSKKYFVYLGFVSLQTNQMFRYKQLLFRTPKMAALIGLPIINRNN